MTLGFQAFERNGGQLGEKIGTYFDGGFGSFGTGPGGVQRGLDWDIDSPFASGQDAAFGDGSYGHTGYSGTSLWIDPKRGTYLIILASRPHPDDRGDARPLRQRIAQIVAGAIPSRVLAGIDVLEAQDFALLAGRRVGLLTNQTGRDAAGRHTIDLLAHARGVHLAMILSPEHGLDGDREGRIGSGTEPATGLPIYSLYGSGLRPSKTLLSRLSAVVVDLQDVGVRFYTYATTMAYVMEAAARTGVAVYILDRPNPITAAVVEGPVLELQHRSLSSYFPMPVRHGMTLGELAEMFNGELGLGAKLTVIPMRAYRRDLWYDQTGLAWVNPSPNLRSLEETTLYPGVALIEGANVSVGRGTSEPFKLVGAPWIDAKALAAYLEDRGIQGVRFAPADFTPASDRYAGRPCHGVRLSLTDRSLLNASELGIELAAALRRLYRDDFDIEPTLGLIGSSDTLKAIEDGIDPRAISAQWQSGLQAFRTVRGQVPALPIGLSSRSSAAGSHPCQCARVNEPYPACGDAGRSTGTAMPFRCSSASAIVYQSSRSACFPAAFSTTASTSTAAGERGWLSSQSASDCSG